MIYINKYAHINTVYKDGIHIQCIHIYTVQCIYTQHIHIVYRYQGCGQVQYLYLVLVFTYKFISTWCLKMSMYLRQKYLASTFKYYFLKENIIFPLFNTLSKSINHILNMKYICYPEITCIYITRISLYSG